MAGMTIIDNKTKLFKDDLQSEIKTGSKVSIAAACFSIYAYRELKKQLEKVNEFRFIFTSPTFVQEKVKKEQNKVLKERLLKLESSNAELKSEIAFILKQISHYSNIFNVEKSQDDVKSNRN